MPTKNLSGHDDDDDDVENHNNNSTINEEYNSQLFV